MQNPILYHLVHAIPEKSFGHWSKELFEDKASKD